MLMFSFCVNVYLVVVNKPTACGLFEPYQRSLPVLYKSVIRSLLFEAI